MADPRAKGCGKDTLETMHHRVSYAKKMGYLKAQPAKQDKSHLAACPGHADQAIHLIIAAKTQRSAV